jgi:hypothetical protein
LQYVQSIRAYKLLITSNMPMQDCGTLFLYAPPRYRFRCRFCSRARTVSILGRFSRSIRLSARAAFA